MGWVNLRWARTTPTHPSTILPSPSGPTYHPTFRTRQPFIGEAEDSTHHQHDLSQIFHRWKLCFIIYAVQSWLHPAESTPHPPIKLQYILSSILFCLYSLVLWQAFWFLPFLQSCLTVASVFQPLKKNAMIKKWALDVVLFYLNKSAPAVDGALPPLSGCDLKII